jgi:Domain of unknown function (DUF4157)
MRKRGRQPASSTVTAPARQTMTRDGGANSSPRGPQPLGTAGHPLDQPTRAVMETHFKHDFSSVRVHTDPAAASRAQTDGAQAYTAHPDIVFGPGQYRPQLPDGQALIAHELTHIVQQQTGRAAGIQRRPPSMDVDDPLEREANEREGRFRKPGHGGTLPYREAMASMVPPPSQRPAAAKLTDTRERVLATDRPMFKDLLGFVSGLPAQLQALLGKKPPPEPWMTADNTNVQSALRTLNGLATDLSGERFILRFDQPLTGSAVAAYDFLNNEMHLRTFSGAEERTILAESLLHEYAHILQDREAETVFSQQTRPHEATREEDLQREIGARREEVYFAEMLRALGAPIPSSEVFGSQLTNRVFRGQFEQERAGKTKAERSAATKSIRQDIEKAYTGQLATNSSIKSYAIEITRDNRALLYWDLPKLANPRDLGAIPATLTSTDALKGNLSTLVRNLPEFSQLFDRAGGARWGIVTFSIRYDGDHITDFGMQPP